MALRRTAAGQVPSIPTRYVVAMHPADLAWLDPTLPDVLAREMQRHPERTGAPEIGELSVEFEADKRLEQGRPRFWAGFAGDDLLVLANVDVAAAVSATSR